jgi:hypothetical protein
MGTKSPPDSIAAWVKALFEELHDPQVIEVAVTPGVRPATVECLGAGGPLRQRRLPSSLLAGDSIYVLVEQPNIADPDDEADIAPRHLGEAIQYRTLDRTYWA